MAKRVLITGGAGFIAHHLIGQILKTTDWEVVSLDRLDYSGNLNRLHDLLMTDFDQETRKRVNIVFHDLKAELNPLIKSEIGNVDYILHLAAGSHVDRSIIYPMEFVLDNVVGTCNILEFARSIDNLERFVYFSTDEVFGPAPDGIKYEENDRYNSTNPYSATKAGGEELCVAYENTYGIPVYITHTMNVFGQRQHPEKFIPMSIRKVRDGETIQIHSDSTKTIPGSRHYIHAEDVASALLFLLGKKQINQYVWGGAKCPKFNIVGSEELNNLEVAQIIGNQFTEKELLYELIDFHSSRPGHDLRYALDGSKMKAMGWTPAKSVKERIADVVKWTLNNERWIAL
jgi:dTDP-glucose 4,6-dehydratase